MSEPVSPPAKPRRLSRRRFIAAAVLGAPLLAVADALWLEPEWVKVKTVRLASGKPSVRLAHFTDVHHKGDRPYFESVVKKINALSPDFVCFTGDLIEEQRHLDEALRVLSGIKSPLYGVPGNHDFWSKAPFDGIQRCFASTGGAWLMDQEAITTGHKCCIFGASCLSHKQPPLRLKLGLKNILLTHFPSWIKKFGPERFDLILAGHSHGGQFRLPFYGAVMLPYGVDEYDLGLFRTRSGPMYVNPGIGWFPVPIRFNCRPEITLIEL